MHNSKPLENRDQGVCSSTLPVSSNRLHAMRKQNTASRRASTSPPSPFESLIPEDLHG
jgi:hypothetical protein